MLGSFNSPNLRSKAHSARQYWRTAHRPAVDSTCASGHEEHRPAIAQPSHKGSFVRPRLGLSQKGECGSAQHGL